MERGSRKHGFAGDDRLKQETEAVERADREVRSGDDKGKETDDLGTGHRVAGTGSSANTYSYTDRGEEGGESHPKPKDSEDG